MNPNDIGLIKTISWKRKAAIMKQNQEIQRLRSLLAEVVEVLSKLKEYGYRPTSMMYILDKLIEEAKNERRHDGGQ